jgi:uncharacterized repeat protein (TIGR01451 family)
MLNRKLAIGILVLGIWGVASAAWAQNGSDSQQFQPFGGFFRGLFGPPVDRDDGNLPPPPPRNVPRYNEDFSGPTPAMAPPRAGSVRSVAAQPAATPDVPDEPPLDFAPKASTSPAGQTSPATAPAHRVTGENYSLQWDSSGAASKPAADAAPADSKTASSGKDAAAAGDSTPASRPLHERMMSFQHSAFADVPAGTVTAAPTADGASDPPAARQAERTAAVGSDRSAPSVPELPLAAPAASPAPASTAAEPAVPEVPQPPAVASGESRAEKPSAAAEPRAPAGSMSAAQAPAEPGLLFTRKGPILSVETQGPRKIVVGKEAAYEVTIQNSGEVAADDVTVFMALPAWADIVGSTPSAGEGRPAPQGRNEPFQWVVGHLEAKAREKLVLKIVPRQSRPFELAVRWDYKPVSSQATIEVQEPKLVMALDGPREVFFNKREIYKLKLANAGNGPAENVVLSLMPLTTGETQPVSHTLGTLAAGEQRTIEVEMTARQPGNLVIQIEAKGEGGVRAELSERVVVRRAALQVEVEGPAMQYVGTAATYKIRVRNPGDAAAKNVRLAVNLPMGMKYAAGSEGAQLAPGGGKVQWTFDQIEPGGQQAVTLRCMPGAAGAARLEAVSTADDQITAAAEALTQVEGMADLRLEIKDPAGPVPVGEETAYELRVRNRGTKTAENVEVIAYFSAGVEPTSAEGQPNRVRPGQVVFSPIASLGAGSEVLLKVQARAETAGNHIFRAEVHCKVLGTRLVQEETTCFYKDAAAAQQAARPSEPAQTAAPAGDALRTADRRAPQSLPQPPSQPAELPAAGPPPLPVPPGGPRPL